jgi:small subunit ribosomal protein S6
MEEAKLLQHEYESIVIYKSTLDDSAIDAIANKFEGIIGEGAGTLLDRDDWGVRKLAYPIQRSSLGHYVLTSFVAPTNLIVELERRMRLEDGVVRFLTIKIADTVDIPTRLAEANEKRQVREDERAAREERAAAEAIELEKAQAAAAIMREKRAAEVTDYAEGEDADESAATPEAAAPEAAAPEAPKAVTAPKAVEVVEFSMSNKKAELLEAATKMGVSVSASMTKAAILEALNGADAKAKSDTSDKN